MYTRPGVEIEADDTRKLKQLSLSEGHTNYKLSDMPDEITLQFFNYLKNDVHSFFAFSTTDKRLHNISKDETLSEVSKPEEIAKINEKLKMLDLLRAKRLDYMTAKARFSQMKSIKKIDSDEMQALSHSIQLKKQTYDNFENVYFKTYCPDSEKQKSSFVQSMWIEEELGMRTRQTDSVSNRSVYK